MAPPALAQSTPARLQSIEADGTRFKVTLSDGRVLRSAELVGATLVIAGGGGARRIRIDAVESDPGEPSRGVPPAPQVFLHTISVENADGSWRNACDAGPDGRRQAFPLAGRAQPDATMQASEQNAFEIVCTAGARGKCVRFGYHPWEGSPADYDLFNACVRMLRGDYCGDGRPFTRNGTWIDLYDDRGIQKPDRDPTLVFEAGWGPNGAVCVARTRLPEAITTDRLPEVCPRLRHRTGTICTEQFARRNGAVIFNHSRP